MPRLLLLSFLLISCSPEYQVKKYNRDIRRLDRYIQKNEQKILEQEFIWQNGLTFKK